MSIDLLAAAWATDLPDGADKIVLLALADYANSDGHAFPSVEAIATKVSRGERAVQFALRRLEAGGHIAKTSFRPDRKRKSSRSQTYIVQPQTGRCDFDTPDLRKNDTRQVRNIDTPEPRDFDTPDTRDFDTPAAAPDARGVSKWSNEGCRNGARGPAISTPKPLRNPHEPISAPSGAHDGGEVASTREHGCASGHAPAPAREKPRKPSPGEALVAVKEAAGMRGDPPDVRLISQWLAIPNTELERDLLPVIRREAEAYQSRTGKSAWSLKFFDAAIKADRDEFARERSRLMGGVL